MWVRTAAVLLLGVVTSFLARAAEPEKDDPPKEGRVIERLSGDSEVEAEPQPDGSTFYRNEVRRVTTPLPEGYPRPTPPEVVEVKSYPEVRRATFAGQGQGQGPNGMKNSATGFWPLFGHIKSRGIAMTAPVEIEYEGLEPGDDQKIDGWNMAFLYRSKQTGPTESYANITVEDAKPVTVVATGIAGDATREAIDTALQQLQKSLAESTDWQPAGDPRVLGYNGPDVPAAERWSEVQLPVTKKPAAAEQDE
ncbi:heme-binding protein [Aeoliella mucimassa]|uniref:SOUL heme-binding protein n=1 Tax=Aeoliella mucimassa TaxID=2527972 RepID=A0A518ANG9_9BACT|nr:heme-binding protein [Aeoliella mucimassa]QDU56267.1 SOUL heme-binding protein [Aeoliella mucimassa]